MTHENPFPTVPPDKLPAVFDAYRESSSNRNAELTQQRRETIQRLNIALLLLDSGKIAEAKDVIARQLNVLDTKVCEDDVALWETVAGAYGKEDRAKFTEEERTEFADIDAHLFSVKNRLATLIQQERPSGATAA